MPMEPISCTMLSSSVSVLQTIVDHATVASVATGMLKTRVATHQEQLRAWFADTVAAACLAYRAFLHDIVSVFD